jgi:hypothetical protein
MKAGSVRPTIVGETVKVLSPAQRGDRSHRLTPDADPVTARV